MTDTPRRNRLLPWYIGIVIVAAADIYVGYKFFSNRCDAPLMIDFMVLGVIPAVYLWLMYLAFISQP